MRSILRLVVRDEAFGWQVRIVSALVITRDGPKFAARFLLHCVYLHAIDCLRFGYAAAADLGHRASGMAAGGCDVRSQHAIANPSQYSAALVDRSVAMRAPLYPKPPDPRAVAGAEHRLGRAGARSRG